MPSRTPPPDGSPSQGKSARDLARALREAAPYLGLGTALAVIVLAGLAGGYWLDGRVGTRPVFLLLGGTLGVGAAMYHLFRTVSDLSKRRAGRER